jgi:hypothetical protein
MPHIARAEIPYENSAWPNHLRSLTEEHALATLYPQGNDPR